MRQRNTPGRRKANPAGLRPERIALAKKRLSEGFYDSLAIRNLVIEKLLADPQFLKTS